MEMYMEDYLEKRPVDEAKVAAHKERMLGEMCAYELRELRKSAGLSQVELAGRIGVSQRQVSKIENGDLENSKVSTIRRYIEALGGKLEVECLVGDKRLAIA
ncbi:helix-turn-helix transcriptional regulator [Mobiluncus holmesii]|uniref:Helix-turn-helix transcriptional regulator n=2 Tax=Mobiluncus porci TaxID=2652278 RepID=A0A7K0K642_9ACTO|nr:helix-turn-helix transcriptional regulator [Mobiluncus porci]